MIHYLENEAGSFSNADTVAEKVTEFSMFK
jgi:hypothetical protein